MVSAPKRPIRPRARRRSGSGSVSYLAIVVFVGAALVGSVFWPVPLWVAAVYAVASVVCCVAYAIDKRAAVAGRWRVSEKTLLLLGFLGGWPGAIIAQQTLRHKTQKASFRRAFWGSVVLNVLVFAVVATPLLSRFQP
ncbi:DUF1294 domain-containing protein [Cryobacterium frigoriphilum]|uniref:DUF1294 domain-containing protein n=1 Tax=Cryobacterium frigoriphilum TaxID=1259150 RepID=A0A4R9A6A4_9MICO|nr:DUF1294 domain-containing protein [Cryobacterium frigoriphilum]TFD52746.1 DUF1294 domain-containing protein [Cryobacterium frigoriphilum]